LCSAASERLRRRAISAIAACHASPVSVPQIEPTEQRRRRREARRRATRRRRYQAVGVIVLIVAVIVVIASSLGGGKAGGSGAKARSTADRTRISRDAHKRGQSASRPVPSTSANSSSTGPPGTAAVPILMYHVIAAPPPGAPFPGLYVLPSEFAAQMEALKRAGWHAVTLDQVQAYWLHGVSLGPGKPIVLSFDNGYQSQYTQALPVLERLGWVADENVQLTGLPPSQGGLSQAQIKGLVAAGWELDTQGFSHADLITLDAEELHYQVAVARSTVQQRYGVPVNWFCYPSGHYDATVIAAVKAAGYTGSTTVVPGWAHPSEDRYRLHRLRVLGETSPETLLSEIASIREDPPAPSSYNGA
jgi:peptidoglycan/xylan/chitin deacetylase (PgdA/CDA1 family)